MNTDFFIYTPLAIAAGLLIVFFIKLKMEGKYGRTKRNT